MSAQLFLLTAFFVFTDAQVSENDLAIYYDAAWKPVPLMTDGVLKENTLRYGILPCTCQDLTCGCCLNMNIQFMNFSRSGCMNFTYLPMDFAIEMNVLMNDESVFKRSMSAKNPPPACMQVPIPTYLPDTQFCIKIFDIYTPGRNIHMCMDFETRIARAPVLVLQFDCFEMGCDGFSNVKPTQSSGAVVGSSLRTHDPQSVQWRGICSSETEETSESSTESRNIEPTSPSVNLEHFFYKPNSTVFHNVSSSHPATNETDHYASTESISDLEKDNENKPMAHHVTESKIIKN